MAGFALGEPKPLGCAMRARRAAALLLACCPGFGALAYGAGPRADEAAFLSRHRCRMVSTLEAIHATPAKTDQDQNRFLIVYRPEATGFYVQCVFFDWDANILCEASSGFFEGHPGQPREHYVFGQRLQALARLGFSLDDSQGNYVRRFPVAGSADFPAVADFILSALYEGYGLSADAGIGVEAPDANREAIESRCAPIS